MRFILAAANEILKDHLIVATLEHLAYLDLRQQLLAVTAS